MNIKEIIKQVFIIIIVFIIVRTVQEIIILNAIVPTSSMENTIMIGDRIIGNRLAYINNAPERGDIIIFKFPDDTSKQYIKRVIGLPGDKIQIKEGIIFINDKKLYEPYLKEEWIIDNDGYEYIVPEDSYFVLGDNRNDSNDSRYWLNTYVTKDLLLAKAECIYYPFNQLSLTL